MTAVKARMWRQFHAYATVVWATLVVPTLVWWRDSIPWVAFMSVYACVIGHWSSYQASRAEQNGDTCETCRTRKQQLKETQ